MHRAPCGPAGTWQQVCSQRERGRVLLLPFAVCEPAWPLMPAAAAQKLTQKWGSRKKQPSQFAFAQRHTHSLSRRAHAHLRYDALSRARSQRQTNHTQPSPQSQYAEAERNPTLPGWLARPFGRAHSGPLGGSFRPC